MNTRKQQSLARRVPAYAPNGDKLRLYSIEQCERLLAMKPIRLSAKYNKRTGLICSIQFLPQPTKALSGNESLRKTAHMGQAYSYKETITDGSGRQCWQFSPFLVPRAHGVSYADVEAELQRIFRAVPLSCLVREAH